MSMEVTLIGMGPGDPSALTGGALTALVASAVLAAVKRRLYGNGALRIIY